MKKNITTGLCFIAVFAISINLYSQNLIKYRDGFLWGFKDGKTQQVVIKAKYGYADDFKDGLAVVSEGATTPNQREKLRIINSKGAYVIDTTYQKITNIGKGLAVFGISGEFDNFLFGLVDKNGKYILAPEYSKISDISDGLIVIVKDKQSGAIDLTGKFIIALQSDFVIDNFKCSVSIIRKNYQFGLMDKLGSILISPDSSGIVTIYSFNKNCIAEFKKDNRYGLMNSKGKIIVEPIYSRSSGLKDDGVTYYKDNAKVEFNGSGIKK